MNIIDIAKRFKVAPSTVSRALNPATENLISEKVRNRIKSFAQKVNYVPNRSARELVTGRTKTIGILHVTSFEALFFADHSHKFLEGLYREMEEHLDYTCKIVMHAKGGVLSDADRRILSSQVDGLLILSQVDHLAEEIRVLINQQLANWKHPIVALNLEPHKPVKANLVYFSNYETAKMAVTHLVKTNHKRIALVYGNNEFPGMKDRFDAYRDVLRDHKLPIEAALMKQGHYHADGAYDATLQLLKKKSERPSAIFCTTDQMAAGCLKALKVARVRCPADVAVIGIDGLAMGAFLDPTLTSVYVPTFEIASEGVRLIVEKIESGSLAPSTKIVPPKLISRQSA